MCPHTHAHMHTCTHAHMHTCTHTCTHAHIHTHTPNDSKSSPTDCREVMASHTRLGSLLKSQNYKGEVKSVCVCVCVCACMVVVRG